MLIWKTNADRCEFSFDSISKYSAGIIQYGAIVIKHPVDGNTWTATGDYSAITVTNLIRYGSLSDPNAVTTGFIPTVPFNIINDDENGYIYIDLRIKPGLPAQFPEDPTNITGGSTYCASGMYTGQFTINVFSNSTLVDMKIITYTFDMPPLLG